MDIHMEHYSFLTEDNSSDDEEVSLIQHSHEYHSIDDCTSGTALSTSCARSPVLTTEASTTAALGTSPTVARLRSATGNPVSVSTDSGTISIESGTIPTYPTTVFHHPNHDEHEGMNINVTPDTSKCPDVDYVISRPASVLDDGDAESSQSKRGNYCRKVLKFCFSHIGLCGMVIAYAVTGGFIFEHLEKTNEKQECVKAMEKYEPYINDTVFKLWAISQNFQDEQYQREALEEYRKLMDKYREGVMRIGYDGSDCDIMGEPGGPGYQWSFAGALLFSVTVITTIGYGNIAPKTYWGRLVCIAYATLGIPLMLLCLANIGDVMADIFRFVYAKTLRCVYYLYYRARRKEGYELVHIKRLHFPRADFRRPGTSIQDIYKKRRTRRHQRRKVCCCGCCRKRFTHKSDSPRGHPDGDDQDITTGATCSIRDVTDGATCKPYQTQTTASATCSFQDITHVSTCSVEDQAEAWQEKYMKQNKCQTPGRATVVEDYDDYYYDDDMFDEENRISVPLTITMAVIAGYVFMGALLFGMWEGWEPLQASYFCFVTISTIGFGDLVPGAANFENSEDQYKMILSSVYMMFGMAILSMCFSLIQEEIVSKFRWVGEKIGILEKENMVMDIEDEEYHDDYQNDLHHGHHDNFHDRIESQRHSLTGAAAATNRSPAQSVHVVR